MTLAHFIVIEVMGRRYFNATRSKFWVDIVVSNNWDSSITERQVHEFADQVGVALVFRVNSYCRIPKHGLWSGSRNCEVLIGVGDRVVEVPQMAIFLFRDYFQIGDGGVQLWIPVHQAVAAINQSFVIEIDKDFLDHSGKLLIHGEAFTGPIQGGTHASELLRDDSA